jgi:hypothetical protein
MVCGNTCDTYTGPGSLMEDSSASTVMFACSKEKETPIIKYQVSFR